MDRKYSKSKSRSKSKPQKKSAVERKSPVIRNQPKLIKQNSKQNLSRAESPKTIDYSKVIEKYGRVIDNESPQFNRRNSRLKKKNSYNMEQYEQSYRQIKQYTKSNTSFHSNQTTVTNNTKSNEKDNTKADSRLKQELEIAEAKIALLEEEKFRGTQLFLNQDLVGLNNSEIEMLKTKVLKLEKENGELKHYSTKRLHEKVAIMLKLFRKYSKKLTQLVPLCEGNPSSSLSSDLFNDLRNTIDQFNNTVNHEKLYSMFNLKHFTQLNNKIDQDDLFNVDQLNRNIDLSEFEPNSNSNILTKYENKIKKLREQKDNLTQTIKDLEIKENDAINRLKSKLDIIRQENKDLKANEAYLKEINKELQTKIERLASNETKYKLQSDTISKLKNQIASLETEIKYKETTIVSFEKKIQNLQEYQSMYSNQRDNYDLNNYEQMNNNFNKQTDSSTNIFNHKFTDGFNSGMKGFVNCSSNNQHSSDKYINHCHVNNKMNEDPSIAMFDYSQHSFHKSPADGNEENKLEPDTYHHNENNDFISPSESLANNKKLINQESTSYNEMFNNIKLVNDPNEQYREQPENLQNEIDILDEEICSLKSKLKIMMTTTNNNIIN